MTFILIYCSIFLEETPNNIGLFFCFYICHSDCPRLRFCQLTHIVRVSPVNVSYCIVVLYKYYLLCH